MDTKSGSERTSSTFTPHYDAPPISDRAMLEMVVRAIRRRMRLVIGLPLVFAALATGLSVLRARNYSAHSAFLTVEPSTGGGAAGSLGAIASQLGVPSLGALATATTTPGPQFYGDLLTSNTLVQAVVTTRFDASVPGEAGGRPFTGTLLDYYGSTGKTPADREIAAMRSFARNSLKVAVDRPTGVVRFEVVTKNRRLSELVARRLLDLVNDFNLRRRQTQASNERDFAARRAAASLDSLHAAENALSAFRSGNIDFSRSPRLAERETELQRRVAMAQQIYSTIAQRYELSNLEAVRNTPVITILDAPEGLVEALPRHTRAIAFAALVLGLLVAVTLVVRQDPDLRQG